MKPYLSIQTARLIILALCFALSPLVASAQSIGGTPFLAVHGSARIEVVPDVFPVRVTLSELGMDVSKSQALVEGLTGTVLAKARSLNLAEADIRVGELSVSPEDEYDSNTRKSVFRGNDYSRTLEFKFHTLVDLKQFLAGTPSGKQVSVQIMAFECSTADEIERKLLVNAVADARKTADTLAAAIGRRVSIAQTISTSPMTLSAGSYINAIDVTSVRSSTVVTAEQISRIPVGRNVTVVNLLAPGAVKSDMVLEKGSIELSSDVYIVYLLGD